MTGLVQIATPPELLPGVELSADFSEFDPTARVEETVRFGREVLDDLTFPTARAWARSGRSAVACFPVYTPQELIHAMGMLPVTLQGGGENLDIARADASLGSFLCSISKSTLELALTDRLEPFRAVIFPYICDVSRNLEGIFSRALPGRATHMLHLPQNFRSAATIPFLVTEYGRLARQLEKAGGLPLTADRLAASLALFSEHRRVLRELADLKRERPWDLPIAEAYVLRRLGNLLPREVHLPLLRGALDQLRQRKNAPKDAVRVILVGSFCEQPTLDLLELIEQVGGYIVGDELLMGQVWHGDVPPDGDPLAALARAYVESPVDLGVRATPTTKGEAILERVRAAKAQAVLFLTAKFCEPALEDVVLYRRALDREHIPYLHLEFEEKSTAYEQSRLQLETFVESILLE